MKGVQSHHSNGVWVAAVFMVSFCATTAVDLLGGSGASIRWADKLSALVFGGLGAFLGGWIYSGLRSRFGGWVVAAATAGIVASVPLAAIMVLRTDGSTESYPPYWIVLAGVLGAALVGVLWAWCARTTGIGPWLRMRPNDR